MTVKELLKGLTPLIDDGKASLLDLEVLLAYALGVEREDLVRNSSDEVAEELEKLFRQYVERLAEGEPVAYIVGEKEFYGLNFYVDKRVLVPRPETEGLVDRTLAFLQMHRRDGEKVKILDLGTGSGNIAVAIAKECERIGFDVIKEIEAMDISEEALEVARLNVAQHGVEDKVHVFLSDLTDVIEEDSYFDVILANLPYIGEKKNHFVEKNVEKYEPGVALFGGADGLALYRKLFSGMQEKNISFGLMMGEFGFTQSDALREILEEYFGENFAIEKDLAGMDRFFVVKGA